MVTGVERVDPLTLKINVDLSPEDAKLLIIESELDSENYSRKFYSALKCVLRLGYILKGLRYDQNRTFFILFDKEYSLDRQDGNGNFMYRKDIPTDAKYFQDMQCFIIDRDNPENMIRKYN